MADISESLAFQWVSWESRDEDIADVFNQLNRDLDLDALIRKLWWELYTYSWFVVAMWWATRQYRMRGQTESGNKRTEEHTLTAPVAMTTLDPSKVVPAGSTCLRRAATVDPVEPVDVPPARAASPAAAEQRPVVVWIDVYAADQESPFLRYFTARFGLRWFTHPRPRWLTTLMDRFVGPLLDPGPRLTAGLEEVAALAPDVVGAPGDLALGLDHARDVLRAVDGGLLDVHPDQRLGLGPAEAAVAVLVLPSPDDRLAVTGVSSGGQDQFVAFHDCGRAVT